MTGQLGHGRTADVQEAAAVVVQLQREVRRLTRLHHAFQPLLQRGILRRKLRVGRLVAVAVQVLALEIESRAAKGHAVLVRHWQHVNTIAFEVFSSVRVILEEPPDEPFHDPVATGLPGVRPRAEEHTERRL